MACYQFIDEFFRKWVFVSDWGRFAKGFSGVDGRIGVAVGGSENIFGMVGSWFVRFAKRASCCALFGWIAFGWGGRSLSRRRCHQGYEEFS